MANKKKGKKKKMRFRRAPSKLPADRVLKSNQYLHIQRQLDELRGAPLAKTRGDRGVDYVRGQGLPLVSNVINVGMQQVKTYQSLNAAEKEALDRMRDEPDILKGLHKKQVDSALKAAQKKERAATEEWNKARAERDRLGASRTAREHRERRPARGGGTPTRRRRSTTPTSTGATAFKAAMAAAGDLDTPTPKVTKASRKAARTAFMEQSGTPGGSIYMRGASHSPQTNFGWDDE